MEIVDFRVEITGKSNLNAYWERGNILIALHHTYTPPTSFSINTSPVIQDQEFNNKHPTSSSNLISLSLYFLSSSSQPPAYIDQRTCRTDVRQRPRQSNVTQIRRVVHQQLRNDVEAQQIDYLRIVGCQDLCKRCSECEA